METVYGGFSEYVHNALAIDSQDRVHISFCDDGDSLKYAYGQIADTDSDSIPDVIDNCLDVHNPDQNDVDNDCIGDICDPFPTTYDPTVPDVDGDSIGDVCDNCPNDYNPNQEDTFPPQGNNIGDACDCESDFDCNGNVDAGDVTTFLNNFGRNQFSDPCTNENQCSGDTNCDGNVDAGDINKFLEDFGRNQFINPCPACVLGVWCVYP